MGLLDREIPASVKDTCPGLGSVPVIVTRPRLQLMRGIARESTLTDGRTFRDPGLSRYRG